jgi:hypothetical protein
MLINNAGVALPDDLTDPAVLSKVVPGSAALSRYRWRQLQR